MASIKSKRVKEKMKEDWLMQLKEAKTLALLDNVHKVKCIAWVPECSSNGSKLTHEDGTLKGKYIVKYEEHH